MSRQTVWTCDICRESFTNSSDITTFKAYSRRFPSVTFDRGRKKFDICQDCLEEIGRKIRADRGEKEE
jgi:hypothetical protein